MSESGSLFEIRLMRLEDVPAVVGLQKAAFPPPFPQDYHWDAEHLEVHIRVFPEAQWVAVADGQVVGSCSNSRISEENWLGHDNWYVTVGGPELRRFDPNGSTLYGLDITVAPSMRRRGVGRAFYGTRFAYVQSGGLKRFGTGCRIPDLKPYLASHPTKTAHDYVDLVVSGGANDRVLTPLLRMGLKFVGLVEEYMQDEESLNHGALLEGPI